MRADDIKQYGVYASAQHFGFVLKDFLGLANDMRISQHLFTYCSCPGKTLPLLKHFKIYSSYSEEGHFDLAILFGL